MGTGANDAAEGEDSSVRGVEGDGCESVPSDFAPITGGTLMPLVALRLPSPPPSLDDKICTVETGASAKASAGGDEAVAEFFTPVAPSLLPEGDGGKENVPSPDLAFALSLRLPGDTIIYIQNTFIEWGQLALFKKLRVPSI